MGLIRIAAFAAIVFTIVRVGEDTPSNAPVASIAESARELGGSLRQGADFCASRTELCTTMAIAGAELARREAVERLASSAETVKRSRPAPSKPPRKATVGQEKRPASANNAAIKAKSAADKS